MKPATNIGPEHAAPARLPKGFAVGGCVVDGWLRDGGMAAIYRARRTLDDRRVALKVQLPSTAGDAAICTRFDREAEVLARANGSAHVVELYGSGQLEDGRRYFMMEWVEGENLEEVLDFLRNEDQRLPLVRACKIGRDVARGLVELHEHGVLHLDLKPANVMVTYGDAGDEVKLVDFGIAADLHEGAAHESIEHDEGVMGTQGYMAPEQAQGAPASASFDVYALGVLLFESITGSTVPSHGWSPETLPRVEKLRRGVPTALSDLVRACMDFDPGRRPASAAVVMTELMRIIAALEAGGGSRANKDDVTVRSGKTEIVPHSSMSRGVAAQGPARTGGTELMTHEEVLSRSGLAINVEPEVVERARRRVREKEEQRRRGVKRARWVAMGGVGVLVMVVGGVWLRGAGEEVVGEGDAAAGVVAMEGGRELAVEEEEVVVGQEPVLQEEVAQSGAAPAALGEAGGDRDALGDGAEGDVKPEASPLADASVVTETLLPAEPSGEPGMQPAVGRPREKGPSPEACKKIREDAVEAKRGRAWRQVLKKTKARSCWENAAQKLERKQLRVEAYAELDEFEKCIDEGGRAQDALIETRVNFCRNQIKGSK